MAGRFQVDSPLGAQRLRYTLFETSSMSIYGAASFTSTKYRDVFDVSATTGLGARHVFWRDALRLEYSAGVRHDVRATLTRDGAVTKTPLTGIWIDHSLGLEGRINASVRLSGDRARELRLGAEAWLRAGGELPSMQLTLADALCEVAPTMRPRGLVEGAARLTLSVHY